jgi:aspartyl-tRNA(Asn)/glutamyl-tRNA(Gln) amidotransferase subunit A
MTAIADLSAADLVTAYRTRALSPVEVARDVVARARRFEPAVNAFVTLDEAGALDTARRAEGAYAAGGQPRPLEGVPVTLKDNLAVAGLPNRRGSAITPDTPAAEDAPVAARLREAGAVIIGKTTMPEFGWKGVGDSPLTGITRNPWDTRTGPGGSSSGAAVAAALGLGVIHVGTDGAGSIRIPAAFTGVFGIKPTFGRVPAFPISTMGVLAHLGPLTARVADAALALSVIAGPDPRDMSATLGPPDLAGLEGGVAGLRVAWSPRLGHVRHVDPEIARLAEAAARAFAALGAHVEEADPGFADPVASVMALWSAGAELAMRALPPEGRSRMDPGLVAVADAGTHVTGADYARALLFERGALATTMARFHERFDLLLTPALPIPAFAVGRNAPAEGPYAGEWENWTPFTYPFNLTQQPAASVPCGLTAAGLPAGLQIVGRFGEDALVLQAARAYEAAHPFPQIREPR